MWTVTLVLDWREWSKRLQRHGDGCYGLRLCRRDSTERWVMRRLRHAFGGSWRTRRRTGSTRYWTSTLSKADEDQDEVARLGGQEKYQKSADGDGTRQNIFLGRSVYYFADGVPHQALEEWSHYTYRPILLEIRPDLMKHRVTTKTCIYWFWRWLTATRSRQKRLLLPHLRNEVKEIPGVTVWNSY